MNQRRRPRGRRFRNRRRGNGNGMRQRVARGNYQANSRTFRVASQVLMQQENALQGGVRGAFTIANPISDYEGSNFISENYEQYRVTRVEVFMKPSMARLLDGNAPTTTQESILYQNSIYALANQTEIQSFIDFDTNVNPTYAEILSRPNMKKRALAPNAWTKVADFQPKTLTNNSNSGTTPSNNFGPNVWISTNQMNAALYGFRGQVSNRANVFDAPSGNVACVDTLLQVTVHMRGPKNNPSSFSLPTLANISVPSRPPAPLMTRVLGMENDDEAFTPDQSSSQSSPERPEHSNLSE